MIIKSEKKLEKKTKKNFISIFLTTYFFLTCLIGLIIAYYLGTSHQLEKKISNLGTSISKAGRFEMIYFPEILFKSFLSNFYKINRININLSFKNELILEDYRKKIIREKKLKSSESPRVKVTIEFKEKQFSGRVRLKGDRKAHWDNRKNSSYKFELNDNTFFMGMNKFAIHKPVMRNYIHEWLFHEMVKELEIIGLNYKFIKVSINGTDRGLYALEEGFGKELIERSKRRNGPIFSFREELSMNSVGNWYQDNTNLEVYNKKYWNKKENYQLLKSASDKLNNFFLGNEKLENTFDLEKWASYLAICDLLYTFHGAYAKSVRYYYNPIVGKFEPVAFDGHRGRNHPNYNKLNKDYNNQIILDYLYNHDNKFFPDTALGWLNLFFLDKDKKLKENFYKLYIEKLELVTSESFLNTFLTSRKKEINQINSLIYSDYYLFDNLHTRGPGFYYFSKKDLEHRAKTIRTKIRAESNNYPEYIQAGIEKNKLIIKNYSSYQHYDATIIKELNCEKDKNYDIKKINSNNNYPIVNFQINNFKNKYLKTIINLKPLKDLDFDKCNSVKIENLANKEEYIINFDKINFNINQEKETGAKFSDFSNFFITDGKTLLLKENEVIINKNIFIPDGFKVFLKSGQKIVLNNDAFIISNSPWSAIANENTINISGNDNNFGGGILINAKNEKSYFENVIFSNLRGPGDDIKNEFLIFGSLNFYESKVELNNIEFKNIFSEDAINIIRSNFNIINAKFNQIISDGIDFDFSNGSAYNLSFKNIGNDALDFSGSKANIDGIYTIFTGDKILSAGETSYIEVSNIKSKDSFSGIVSKDGSYVKIVNADFKQIQYPFSAYLKKKEYDKPSYIQLYSTNLIEKKNNYIVDNISKIYVDKKSVGTLNNKLINTINNN